MFDNRLILALPLLVFLGFGFFFVSGIFNSSNDELPSQFIGKDAPELNLASFSDSPIPTNMDLSSGGVTLVNYWASWCTPCRAEHPSLKFLADMGIPIIGINYKDEEEHALAFLNELGNPFTKIGTDKNGRVALEWGVYGIPETFIINGQGKVTLRFPGPITQRVLYDSILPEIEKAKLQ